jgi:hypothetical protein
MNDGPVAGQSTPEALPTVDGRAVSRTAAAGAALLPGGMIYGGIGFLVITNSFPLFLALPAVAVTFGSHMFVQPLVERYAEITGSRTEWTTAFKPSFFRFYLRGKGLAFAYLFNYAAAALALGGWLFLWVAGLAE